MCCLLFGITASSCESESWEPAYFVQNPCHNEGHYDKMAGDYSGYVILRNRQQELDTISTCKVSFGNHADKSFVISEFPISYFSFLLDNDSQWYDVMSQCTDKINLPFTYLMTEWKLMNSEDTEAEEHNHNLSIYSEHEVTIVVDIKSHKYELAVKGVPFVKERGLDPVHDGVSLVLLHVTDKETNNTTTANSSDSSIELIVRAEGVDLYF